GAPAGFAAGGERFRQQIVERFAVLEALAELRRERTQVRVAEGAGLFLEVVDAGHEGAGNDAGGVAGRGGADIAELANVAFVAGAEQAGQETGDAFGEGAEPVAEFFPDANVKFIIGHDGCRRLPHSARRSALPGTPQRQKTQSKGGWKRGQYRPT